MFVGVVTMRIFHSIPQFGDFRSNQCLYVGKRFDRIYINFIFVFLG